MSTLEVQPEVAVDGTVKPAVAAIEIPENLVFQSINTDVLLGTLKSLAGEIGGLKTEMVTLREENATLREEVQECSRKSEVSQSQYGALFETVTTYADQLKALQDDFIGRVEVKEIEKQINDTTQRQKFFMEELDSRKIDTHSTLLENRVRETSEDACARFMLRYERESKDWTMGQLLVVENKVTKHTNDSVSSTRSALEEETKRVEGKLDQLFAQVKQTNVEVEKEFALGHTIEKLFAQKFENHEKAIDTVEQQSIQNCDRIFTNLRIFMNAVGVEWNELSALFPDRTVIIDDEADIEEMYLQEISRSHRQHDFVKGWKSLKQFAPKLMASMPHLADEDPSLDRKRIEQTKQERLKDVDRQMKLRKSRKQQQSNDDTVPAPAKLLMEASLLSHFRNAVQTSLLQNLSSLKEEITTDFATQLQSFNRELRQKIGTGRAVELIEEYATKQVTLIIEDIKGSVEQLRKDAMTQEEVSIALAGKVDNAKMNDKADVFAVSEMEQQLKEIMQEKVEAMSSRLKAQLEGKMKDMTSAKWDKHDSRLLNALEMVESGALNLHSALQVSGGGRTGGKKEVCLSCNRPSPSQSMASMSTHSQLPQQHGSAASIASHDNTAQSPVGSTGAADTLNRTSSRHAAAERQRVQKTEELQAVQELLHLEQMQNAAKSQDKAAQQAQDKLAKFQLKEWVDNVGRTHSGGGEGGSSSSRPASASVQKQSKHPRPPSGHRSSRQ